MFLFFFLLGSPCLLCGLSPLISSFSDFFSFYLSTFSLCLTDFTLRILWNFLLFSVLEFHGNVSANKPLHWMVLIQMELWTRS